MSTTDNMVTKVVKLPPILDAAGAGDLLAKLRQLPEPFWPVQLHAQDVEQLSLAYVQVIMVATMDNENFTIVDPSAVLAETFEELGLFYRQSTPDAQMLDMDESVIERTDPVHAEAGQMEDEHAEEALAQGEEPRPQPSALEDVSEQDLDVTRARDRPSSAPEIAASRVIPICGDERGHDDGGESPPGHAQNPAAERIGGHESPPAEEATAEETAMSKRILTIDDSKTMRDMLRMTLCQAGFTVIQAVDGQDGIEVLSKEQVDVVVTDINMPKMDGYGVIRHIRQDPFYDSTPILVLSTEGDQEAKNVARDAGATGWIVKPFVPDQLVDVLRKVCP